MRRDRGQEPVGCFVLLSALLARSTCGALGSQLSSIPQRGPVQQEELALEFVSAPRRANDTSTSGPRRRSRSPGDARAQRGEHSEVSWAPGVGGEYAPPPEPTAPPAAGSSSRVQPGSSSAPPAGASAGDNGPTATARVDRSAAPSVSSEAFRGGSGTLREDLRQNVGPPLTSEQSGKEGGRPSGPPGLSNSGGDGDTSPPPAANSGGEGEGSRATDQVGNNAYYYYFLLPTTITSYHVLLFTIYYYSLLLTTTSY